MPIATYKYDITTNNGAVYAHTYRHRTFNPRQLAKFLYFLTLPIQFVLINTGLSPHLFRKAFTIVKCF